MSRVAIGLFVLLWSSLAGADALQVATASDSGRVLTADPGFITRPLPAPPAGGYRGFRETARISVNWGYLTQVARLPSGNIVTTSEQEATVRIYDAATRRLTGNYAVPGFAEFRTGGVAAWPELAPQYLVAGAMGLMLFDAKTGEQTKQFDSRPMDELRWSADRRYLATSRAGSVRSSTVLNFFERTMDGGLTPVAELAFEERVDAWDLSADNRLLAVSQYPSGTVAVIDLNDKQTQLFRIDAPEFTGDVAFSPDGRWLAAGGDGLLLVDLLSPSRRFFYSFVKNNIGCVRFSPSSDAIFASSYDGRIRILQLQANRLELVKELQHTGQANVYQFEIAPDGRSVTSASGDKTIRTFSAPPVAAKSKAGAPAADNRFHDLKTWATLLPSALVALPLLDPPTIVDGLLVPKSARLPARPTRIRVGRYACKINAVYKLRDCWVTRDDEGRTHLRFAPDNLFSLEGVLYDDGPVVRYEASLQEKSSLISCKGCEHQPLHGVFRGSGGSFTGLLLFRNYYDPRVMPPLPAPDVKIEEAMDRHPLVLSYRGPLVETQMVRR